MIWICEHHDEVLRLWRRRQVRNIALAHVDFHDDLRGLFIDRRRRRAFPIGRLGRGAAPLDPGNFLAHAVLEGRVRGIRWVHDRVGGRAWDTGIVRYETDLFGSRHRLAGLVRRPPSHELEFVELLVDAWDGPQPGERLSIDWDCFASILQDEEGIERRVGAFLERLGSTVPPEVYLVYSPEYSRPTLTRFRTFAEDLGRRFALPCEWLSPGLREGQLHPTGVAGALPRSMLLRCILFLRRRGIY